MVLLRLVPSLNSHHRLNSHRLGLHTVVEMVVLKIPSTEVVVVVMEVWDVIVSSQMNNEVSQKRP